MADEKNTNVEFEEMEQVEEYGDARDFIEGVGIGLGAVAAVVGIITLT